MIRLIARLFYNCEKGDPFIINPVVKITHSLISTLSPIVLLPGSLPALPTHPISWDNTPTPPESGFHWLKIRVQFHGNK